MKKVIIFSDPGIDDSVAIMYALLHPEIDVVGIVTSYGNVDQEQATNNAAYLLSLVGREDIPIYAGANYPFSGEIVRYYPEIHGEEGLGPIQPPDTIEGELLNFSDIFDLIENNPGEITIIDVGRLTSLAMAFIIGGEIMEHVKEYYIMGGAFLVPGNVTEVAEANFYGDPIAANLVMQRGQNVTLVPLNVTNRAIITEDIIDVVTAKEYNEFTPLLEPIFEYYKEAYEELIPELNGALFHDVLAVYASINRDQFDFAEREVQVVANEPVRGQSIANFRPIVEENGPQVSIALGFDYNKFINDVIETLTIRQSTNDN